MQDINYQHESQGAASRTPIIDELREAWYIAKRQSYRRVPRFEIPEGDFMAELRAHGCIAIAEKGDDYSFEYDDNVREIARQLWLYTTGNAGFEGNLNKGIALTGWFGCGKSLIMDAYSRLVNYHIGNSDLTSRHTPYEFMTSFTLFGRVQERGVVHYSGINLIIDEIGREAKVAKNWGTETMPIVDLLFERHRKGVITHITANYSLDDLSKDVMYGAMLGDRFREMFNFIHMRGGSKRK